MRLPRDVQELLLRTEWNHPGHFRDQLLGVRNGARIALNPPSGNQAADDPVALRTFREQWERLATDPALHPCVKIRFEERKLRLFGALRLPIEVAVEDLQGIARLLGSDAVERLRLVNALLQGFYLHDESLGRAAARHVGRLEGLTQSEAAMMARALSQMRAGLGEGTYLRALPIERVDTKFLERHAQTAYLIINAWTSGAVEAAGGLEAWLGCKRKGTDRILVRPLCAATQAAFCGARMMWLTSDDLAQITFPGTHLLIVENEISGLELPSIESTVAVAGTGGNLAWLQGLELDGHRVGYWGDIDSWGLRMLSVARCYCAHLEPLLMDEETFEAHAAAVVTEDRSDPSSPESLTEPEQRLRYRLLEHATAPARLEQEKLNRSWIKARLDAWRHTPTNLP